MNRYVNWLDEFNAWPWDSMNDEYHPYMKTDVLRDKQDLVFLIEMPGMKKENINVSLDNGVLAVFGTKEQGDGKYVLREIKGGKMMRKYRVGSEYDPDTVCAKYENGILSITLRKKEEKKTFINIQ